MAKLSAAGRRRLKSSTFAYPPTAKRKGKYPLPDKNHAYVALRESMRKKTFGTYAHVRKKVNAKFPSLRGKGPGSAKRKRR